MFLHKLGLTFDINKGIFCSTETIEMTEFIKIEGNKEVTRSSDEAIQSVIDKLDREAHGLNNLPVEDVEILKPISFTRDLDKTIEVIESFSEKTFVKNNPIHIQELRSQLIIASSLKIPVLKKVIEDLRKAA